MGDLCREFGLSERGFENLFRDLVGMGPAVFLRHERLRRSHRALLAADPAPGAVKEAAIEAGFRYLGRLAGVYQTLFGELPNETLRRNGGC